MNDAILRQDAIKALDGTLEVTGIENAVAVTNYLNALRERIMCLPSAQPERKTGKWVDYPIVDGCLQCSVCGILRFDKANYCPNCGAYMWGEEDDV